MYRKYNTRLFKEVQGTPFQEQKISDGTIIKLYSLNSQPFYQAYMDKNMYYVWGCKKNEYIMLVDDDYYQKFSELFSEEANIIFINHLNRQLKTMFINKIITFSLFGIALLVLLISLILSQLEIAKMGYGSLWAVIGVFVVVMSLSFIFRRSQQKSLEIYRKEIRELFGEQGVEDMINRQTEFYESKLPPVNDDGVLDEPTGDNLTDGEDITKKDEQAMEAEIPTILDEEDNDKNEE